jgi:hypothetical protein
MYLLYFPNSSPDQTTLLARLLACVVLLLAGRVAGDILNRARSLLALLPAQEQEAGDDNDPVEIVRDDRAVRRAVLPAEERVEDTPSAVTVFEG